MNLCHAKDNSTRRYELSVGGYRRSYLMTLPHNPIDAPIYSRAARI
ncbi:MAG: hypothetical protein QM613_04815 [Micrococcaceae bacterium]